MQKIKTENMFLQEIPNSFEDGVVVKDINGKFLYINQAAKKIVGVNLKNGEPKKWSGSVGFFHLDKITPYTMEQLLLTLTIKNNEVKHEVIFAKNKERPEGYYIDASASVLKNNRGINSAVIIIFRDITQLILMEEKSKKLLNALHQTGDSIIITDANGVIEYVNPMFEKTTGYKCKEVLGQTPRILKSGKHNSGFYKNLWSIIKTGNIFFGRILNKKKNHDLYWSEQTITPMKDKDGNITNYVSILRDISETVKIQKQKLQLQISQEQSKKFKEINLMKSRFFANISHEFRTPLTLIIGSLDILISKFHNEHIQKYTKTIKRNADQLLVLTNQLLDLSKLEAGKIQFNASKGNIVSFIKILIMSFESIADRKHIVLKIKSSKDYIELYFDNEKMTKIIMNLLSNAFKFTPESGQIIVSVMESEHNSVIIKIKNTGVGILQEDLPKLFDRFYQAGRSYKREQEGTGIGLALTKELVELHKGSIQVKSKKGKYTEFIIRFHLGKNHLKNAKIVDHLDKEQFKDPVFCTTFGQTNNPVLEKKELNKEQNDETIILVVEDNVDVRKYIRDSLDKKYQIEEAVDGEEGLDRAKKVIPDIIISDIMMPKMSGTELTRILKNDERTSHIPIILLTAKAEQESKIEGLETGADAYLIKPFYTKELLVRIENLLNTRKKLHEKYRSNILMEKMNKKKLCYPDEKFMNRVIEVIEKHITEEEFTIEEFDREIGMGRVQIYRKIKALTGKSPSRYIRSIRLTIAKNMMMDKKGNVSEIAYSVGFASPAYFTKCFKKEFGFLPSDFNKSPR